jgi:hypothetical protein
MNSYSGLGALDPMPSQAITTPTGSMAAGGSPNFSPGGGIFGPILSSVSGLLTTGAQFYMMQQQIKEQGRLAKTQQQQPQIVYAPAPQNQNTLIFAIGGGAILLLLIVMMVSKKGSKDGSPSIPGTAGSGGQVRKIVRRVKRPK